MNGSPAWSHAIQTCAAAPVSELPAALAGALDGATVDLWVWDHQRRSLGSIATGERVNATDLSDLTRDGSTVVPLQHLGHDIGLMTVDGATNAPVDGLDTLAALAATAVIAAEGAGDTLERRRRTREMSLPAELQWSLLPPTGVSFASWEVSAAIEPAYDTGGDIYDYAIDRNLLFLAVLDARGHGLAAATTSAVAASAMRRARRHGGTLLEIAEEVSAAVGAIGQDADFVSAVMVELDVATWRGSWLTAGHVPPLIVGDGEVRPLPLAPSLPLGLTVNGASASPTVQPFALEPGSSLVLYSDGIVENLDDGAQDIIGDARFHEALRTNLTGDMSAEAPPDDRHAARSVVESLLDMSAPDLRDDATLIIATRGDAVT